MPLAQARIKAIAQAPPAGAAVAAAFAAFYFAAAPVGHFVANQATEWLKPKVVYLPAPVESPKATPTTEPSPIASLQPKPAPTHASKFPIRVPQGPKATPFAGLDLPPPIAPFPPDSPLGPPIIGYVVPHMLPPERVTPRPWRPHRPWTREFPRHFGGESWLPRHHDGLLRVPGEFGLREREGFLGLDSGGFRHHLGGPIGGFPFAHRPRPGGIFLPRLPFGGGGFGHFHLF